MAKKPKVKDEEEVFYSGGEIGSGPTGSKPVGTSQGGTLDYRIVGTGAYEIQPYFRAGMRAELQKFGHKEEARQLMLGEDSDLLDTEQKVEVYGLDLSVSQDKAFHAVQKLLAKTGYKGNIPGEERQITSFKWQGYIPRLSITYPEYYEAYGLSPAGDGRYHGAQAQEALLALKSLTETRMIYYKRDRWTGSGKTKRLVSDIVKTPVAPVSVWEGYKGLEAEETRVVLGGGDIPGKRINRLIIEVSPLLVDQIDTFYLLKPSALHAEIQALMPGKRYAPTIPRFISFLLTLDKREIHISRSSLARKLRLDYLIDQRKPSALDKKIREALDTALELSYLLTYEIKPVSKKDALIELRLNPEKCIGLKSKKGHGKKQEGS